MKITSVEQLKDLSAVIGRQNVEGCTRAFQDGVSMWVFQSPDEVEKETELTPQEREFCLRRFDSGEKWAGIFRRPEPPVEPGIIPHPNYDTHGNRIRGGPASWEPRCH